MSQAGGIGRYTVNLLRSLCSMAALSGPAYEFVLFTGPQTSRHLLDGLDKAYRESFCAVKSSLLRSCICLPVAIARQGIDVFHGLDQAALPFFLRRAKHIVTIHDVIPILFPRLFTVKHRLIVRAVLARVAQQADRVIVPSQAVRQDVLQHLRISADRVVIIPEGCEARFRPVTDRAHLSRIRTKYGLPGLYMLSLGTLEPRKNITALLHAFAHLRHTTPVDPALRLVIAGPRGWRDHEIFATVQRLGLATAVLFPGFIEEEDLPALYSGAILFVFPSLYEGFGLPILEAMGCGVPVITSNLSALPEVAGDGALFVNPYDIEAIAAAMAELLGDEQRREHLRRKGLVRAQTFSWEETARKTFEIYRGLEH